MRDPRSRIGPPVDLAGLDADTTTSEPGPFQITTVSGLAHDGYDSQMDQAISVSFAPIRMLGIGVNPSRNTIVYRGAAGALALPWYDGAMLMLVREPA